MAERRDHPGSHCNTTKSDGARNALFDLTDDIDEDEQDLEYRNSYVEAEWECVIDNTVNRVMESYRNILSELNELEEHGVDGEDHQVQESAILSAINYHGLHQPIEFSPSSCIQQPETLPEGPQENSLADFDFLADIAISTAINHQGLSISSSSSSLSSCRDSMQSGQTHPTQNGDDS